MHYTAKQSQGRLLGLHYTKWQFLTEVLDTKYTRKELVVDTNFVRRALQVERNVEIRCFWSIAIYKLGFIHFESPISRPLSLIDNRNTSVAFSIIRLSEGYKTRSPIKAFYGKLSQMNIFSFHWSNSSRTRINKHAFGRQNFNAFLILSSILSWN